MHLHFAQKTCAVLKATLHSVWHCADNDWSERGSDFTAINFRPLRRAFCGAESLALKLRSVPFGQDGAACHA